MLGERGDKTFHLCPGTEGNKREPPPSWGAEDLLTETLQQNPGLPRCSFGPQPSHLGSAGSHIGPLLAWSPTQVSSQLCCGLNTSNQFPHPLPYPAVRNGTGVHFPRAIWALPRPTETWNRALGKGDKPSTEGQARGTSKEATPSSLGPLNLVINRTSRSRDTVPSSFPQIRMCEAQKFRALSKVKRQE